MLFSSSVFIFLFLPIVVFIYYVFLRKSRPLQNIFLLLASLAFYAWGEVFFVFIMILSIAANYLFGILVHRAKQKKAKKSALAISVVFNLSILFVFKYLTFGVSNINNLFGLSIPVADIALPIGISFFTFQAMSYVIDVYRGEPVQKNILNVGLYISFFPQLIAGPIVRYHTIADQIQNRRESFDDFSAGVCRFIIGLGKKVLLANSLAVAADAAFDGNISSTSASFAWVGAVAYSLQIFFDFSGYSDMALGLGRMFGFHFLENFNYPYISGSITEFWRRWHISLGTWFRDYVYFPLGGSRVKSRGRLILNLFIVWMLTGIWHGANWTFFVWGLMYFVFLTVEKLTGLHKKQGLKIIRHIYTLLVVVIGWVIFRSDTLLDAWNYIAVMFGGTGRLFDNSAVFFLKENIVYFAAGLICCTPAIRLLYHKLISKAKRLTSVIAAVSLLAITLLSVVYIIKGTYNPFIYFNF